MKRDPAGFMRPLNLKVDKGTKEINYTADRFETMGVKILNTLNRVLIRRIERCEK